MYTYASSHHSLPLIQAVPATTQPSLTLAWRGGEGYETLAGHITAVYRNAYGANIDVTYPLLMGLVDANAKPLAALGVRLASEESPLFLEQYLDCPAEHQLQAITKTYIPRHAIAESGNLASSGKGDILKLLYGLACHLEQEGMVYILFTGTSLLKRYLNSLGLYPYVLAKADPVRLGEEAVRWGSYYVTQPRVMAGSVTAFRTGLEQYFANAGRIWQ